MADLREVRTADESRELTAGGHGPSIIISSSGMATGGRVLHHLERMLPDPRNAVVLTGYQAVGTRGRQLLEGATRLKMHGHYVGVKAEIVRDEEFSVHADASELVDWVRDLDPAPGIVYCTHGEKQPAAALAARVTSIVGVDAIVPSMDEVVLVEPASVLLARDAPDVPAGVGDGLPADSADAAAPDGARAAVAGTGVAEAGVPARLQTAITLDGVTLSEAEVDTDLKPRQEADGTIVLEGTISIRLRP